MNLQPLEYFEAIYACGLKLLHRNYAGPLLQVVRHNDGTEVLVYPDVNGSVSLDSPIELLSGNSQSGYLGEFLCVGSYTADAALGSPTPSVTAGVVTMFDQSVNINNLTNTDTATQPLLCDNGSVFFTDWGLGVSFSSGRYFETDAIEQSFTLHMRMQFLNTVGSRYLFRQTDNAVYAKVTDTYLDEAVGTDSTVVFLNESYFRDYTTYDIQLPIEEAALVTLEVSISDNTLSSPTLYRIEGADLVHSLVMYSGVDEHVRRHVTNKVLAEDVSTLAEKLNRFNPQSYYNLVAGAKAMFGTFSFAGVLGQQNTRIMRLKRQVGVVVSYIDLLVDNTGYITLDSPVENPSDDSLANVLGEWVAHPDYNNPDGIAGVDALVNQLYSQINEANYAYAVGFSEPKLYDSLTQTLVSAGLNGVVGLEFYVPGDPNPNKGLILNEPIYAKTVVVVYANKTANYEMNTLLSTGYGAEIYSKFSGAEANVPELGEHGVTMYDQTDFSFTDDGLDINVHVVSLYDDNQKLIVDTTEYPITYDSVPDGIEGTPLEPDARWEFIGASSDTGSFPHKGRICAVIYYDDDKYDQREFIHNYMNTLFGIQNLPISDSTLVEPEIQSTLLTDYPGAAAAYSLRKVNPDYDGPCIRVRRASDNVEIDIRFNSLYEVNRSALNLFCLNTDGYVTRWYDQSSNGNDATQTTTSLQPKIYDASTGVLTLNSKPGVQWDNTDDFLSFPITYPTANLQIHSVFSTNDTLWIMLSDGSKNIPIAARNGTSGTPVDGLNSPVFYKNGALQSITNRDEVYDAYSVNAQVLMTISGEPINTSNATMLWGRLTASFSMNALHQELIIYTSDQSANREGIESEINGHYGIYDSGLLADYPDAAAAYSLRQLNTGYTGPAVRVRRASDNTELNVYFNSSGELDTAAIESHCSGTNGFVSAWFDQSGNGNDATQTSSSLQDKIYDASTGVLLTNSKPSTTPQGFGGYVITGLTGVATTSVFEVIYANQSPTASLDSANTAGKYPYLAWSGQTGSVGRGTNFYLNGSAQSWATRDDVWQAINNQQVLLDYQLDTSDYSDFELRYGLNNTVYAPIRQETVIYLSDQSSNRAGIETNINDFYSIYSPEPPVSAIPVIESTSTYGNTWDGVGSFAVDMPAGVATGDLILVVVAVDESSGAQSAFAPSGYTEISWKTDTLTDVGLLIYYRLADGTEGSTIDVNYNTVGARDFVVYAYRISGSNLAAPTQIYASAPNYFSNFIDFPDVATTSNDSLILAVAAYDGADSSPWNVTFGTPPWPSELEGYNEYFPANFGGVALGWISREVATGSTEVLQLTAQLTDGWQAALIQINNS